MQIKFPNPELADTDGLLAWGGDLEAETLLNAYSKGIFPWYRKGQPILWWSPNPRLVLFPEKLKISDSLRQRINKNQYEIRFDTNFEEVIEYCAKIKRKGQRGTWITGEMQEAYIALHHLGFAHSVEAYYQGKLVGGLYGVSIGAVFFGESMFYLMPDASKVSLYNLVQKLIGWNYRLIDAQQSTSHLISLGAEEVSRKEFLKLLESAVKLEGRKGKWTT